ncbi:MAG: cupin domain-containing protein, partial [Acidobacteriota bacterium]
MGFEVYDYRKDIRNILVTPQIRARFMRMEVGEVSGGQRPGRGHSHDLGQEVFLVLQGRAEFEIDGETKVLGPGQMCVAL